MKNTDDSVVALVDLLGKKWMMRILWELHQKPCTFKDLERQCGNISPTVVSARLKELTAHEFIEKYSEGGYALTAEGRELLTRFDPLRDFANKWYQKKAG